ncbi:preprotein translocase subunit YajC [Zavarzinella formosa]|uniref:preprotein translocase subunit YajC n=1 Tax=Zavarzinella formosa TaxID=360055 RepID=UPI0002DE81FD|nr:preprotein translocase subunit YajC [Zavarzinella formosa]
MDPHVIFDASYAILAQGGDPAQGGAPSWFGIAASVLAGLMFLMFMRASTKQKRELQNALSAMKKNDKVVTSGGIIGVIVAIKENEDEITLKVDDTTNSRIRVLKSSVVKITSGDTTTGEVKTS